jgi:hypothetical protein
MARWQASILVKEVGWPQFLSTSWLDFYFSPSSRRLATLRVATARES